MISYASIRQKLEKLTKDFEDAIPIIDLTKDESGDWPCTSIEKNNFSGSGETPSSSTVPQRSNCEQNLDLDTNLIFENDIWNNLDCISATPRLPRIAKTKGQEERQKLFESEIDLNETAFKIMQLEGGSGLEVRDSNIHGKGIFAKRDYKPFEFVCEYVGTIIPKNKSDQMESFYKKIKQDNYMFRLNNKWVIDATMSGNIARWTNHSCNANCKSYRLHVGGRYRIIYRIKNKKIPAGSELTVDFKLDPLEKNTSKCNCGSANCKGFL